jgi:hypothetical protein
MEKAIAKAGYTKEDANLSMRNAGFDNVVKQVYEWPMNLASIRKKSRKNKT